MASILYLLCRKTLDGSPVRKQDKFPSPFHADLDVEWEKSTTEGVYREASWQNLPYPKASPLSCFSSVTEQEEVLRQFGEGGREGRGGEGRGGEGRGGCHRVLKSY